MASLANLQSLSIARGHRVVGTIHVAIGFGPQADAARNWLRESVLQIELAIEVTLNFGPADANLEVVPLVGGGRRVSHPVDRRALAVLEFPKHEIVLQTVGANCQVIAIRLQIEQDAGTLVDAAGQSLEANRDLAVREILDVGCDHIRKISVGLHAIEELGIAFAVERARLVGYAGR